ncbi:MAG: NAD(P)/FAD-dependent oxidoreductase [Syntrophaceae bacterium]
MAKQYDVIIIGVGPNGMTIGGYLAKAGLKVLMLEKRGEVGGGLATEEVTIPHYLHNTHAIYHMMADYAPPLKDFNIDQYAVKHIYPDLQFAMPLSDGRSICLYRDVEKTCQSIAKISPKDAESYRGVARKFNEIVDSYLAPAAYVPCMPAPLVAAKLEETEFGASITKLSERTPEDIINDLFENEHVRAIMLYACCHWGLEYDRSGVSYMVPLLLDRATHSGLVEGGSHKLSAGLLKAVLEKGGEVRTNVRIKRIIMEKGAAKGVELIDGTEIRASKAVVSTIDTHQTFLKYVGEQNLDKEFVEKIKIWQWEKWSLFALHMALAEAPNFTAAAGNPDFNKSLIYVLGCETSQDLKKQWDALRKGQLLEPSAFNCCFPSVHDPSQAPAGRHSGLISQMAPYRLNGDFKTWLNVKYKEEQAAKLIAVLQKYAPNMTMDKVLFQYIATPPDIENKFPNMVEGSIKQGAYHPLQMGFLRPNEDCSQNATPVKNLYLGGASCFPGGMITFGPGYVAANRIAEDLGITKWWSEPEIVTAARGKGLI